MHAGIHVAGKSTCLVEECAVDDVELCGIVVDGGCKRRAFMLVAVCQLMCPVSAWRHHEQLHFAVSHTFDPYFCVVYDS